VLGAEQELQQPQPGLIAQPARHDYLLRAMRLIRLGEHHRERLIFVSHGRAHGVVLRINGADVTFTRADSIRLYAFLKRLRSNCRSDVNALAKSWKIMHVCA
jgi:hypothetical protein